MSKKADVIPEPGTVYGHVRTQLGHVTTCGIYDAGMSWAACQLRPAHAPGHAAIVDGVLFQWKDPEPVKAK